LAAIGKGHDPLELTIAEVMNVKPSCVYLDKKTVKALEFMQKREKPISVFLVLDH